MQFKVFKNTVLLFVLVMISCGNISKSEDGRQNKETKNQKSRIKNQEPNTQNPKMLVAANQTDAYLPLLKGKRVGIVANQTSVIFKVGSNKVKGNYTHLVDSLITLKVNIKTVFAPEHGFRGTADAGEHIKDGIDTKTGVPIVSLYGDNKKPKPEQLKTIDIMVFDIQDVGARFYTYISSLHYVMEACAEANIPLLLLDRPNPNGHYIDGPILEMENKSFVGMHPIPVVHGMTIGEYASMINGEKWLKNGVQCELKVIPIKNYSHQMAYSLPIKPSPNLPNDTSINLYPSLCFFEGTNVSVGRGTNTQFQVFGSPFLDKTTFKYTFTPKPNEGAKQPPFQDKMCYGMNLVNAKNLNSVNLNWLISAYKNTKNKAEFFNAFFTKLAGTKKLQQQIEAGLSETEIKATWQQGLDAFKKTRNNYLIYK
ncbi:exo-beta-N-acetylmuramidase NamZ domain-containing protein [Mariniflexile jejuense]|uniref:Exo-beta-N-acetylmuramidase NamZ domain-containing protein n=1 Tax=Mariniflexile jejuense TaxID=1173582 RepID=A0ABW3JLL7_9FLAO